jgi:NAD(P)-dependent dehydrogenase (short-subunit alcohol dehydrogenase family)
MRVADDHGVSRGRVPRAATPPRSTAAARDRVRAEREAAAVAARHGRRIEAVDADLATAEDCAQLVAAVERRFGGCDILINNAGSGTNETILEAPDEKWQRYWELHVMAAVRLARGLAPMMQARGGGVILSNASICATQPLW